MKLFHVADLHFSPNVAKLNESVTVGESIIERAVAEKPDLIVLAGDTVDEFDGSIRIDSPPAMAAISFVERLAEVAPVVIVRGTRSHDRGAPWIFAHLKTRHQVYVGLKPEMIGFFMPDNAKPFFAPIDVGGNLVATIALMPSPDKAWLVENGVNTIEEANVKLQDTLRDVFRLFGDANATPGPFARLLVAHGMVNGSEVSSGMAMIGDDIEFSLSDMALGNFDYAALGHVHKHQAWARERTDGKTMMAAYSGSPGRNNFGETEEKGFLMVSLSPDAPALLNFIPTPAREFAFAELDWDAANGVQAVLEAAEKFAKTIAGTFARFRYTIPEEFSTSEVRKQVIEILEKGAAIDFKVEATVIPRVRRRAEGIAQATRTEKFKLWLAASDSEVEAPELATKYVEALPDSSIEDLIGVTMENITTDAGILAEKVKKGEVALLDITPSAEEGGTDSETDTTTP